MAMALEHEEVLPPTILSKAQRYAALSEQITTLSAERDDLKDELKEVVAARGVADEKGHINLPFGRTIGKFTGFQLQRKAPRGYDEDATKARLKAAGLYHRCMQWVEEPMQDEIMAARAEGLLTDEDLDAMFPIKESFAFVGIKD